MHKKVTPYFIINNQASYVSFIISAHLRVKKPKYSDNYKLRRLYAKKHLQLQVLFMEAPPRLELGNRSFADSCLTTWLCRRNAVISISDIDYIKYGLICQALFKNYSKIFYELKKRVYLFISLPIFLSAIEIVPSLLLINSIYLSSSKYSTGTVISMPVSVFIF